MLCCALPCYVTASRRLVTPTVVWNSECRHMLGVVLRELEGTSPGLQDVPADDVQEVRSTCASHV